MSVQFIVIVCDDAQYKLETLTFVGDWYCCVRHYKHNCSNQRLSEPTDAIAGYGEWATFSE